MIGLWVIVAALIVGALIDVYRRRKSPGPRQLNKLSSRDLLLVLIILIVRVVLGIVSVRFFPVAPRTDNRPIPIGN